MREHKKSCQLHIRSAYFSNINGSRSRSRSRSRRASCLPNCVWPCSLPTIFGRLLIHVFSYASSQLVHFQVGVLPLENGHYTPIGMLKPFVIIVIDLLLQGLNLSLVRSMKRLLLRLVRSPLGLQVILSLAELLFKANRIGLCKRHSLHQF